ncbi:MAG: tetratricopeptide repeat protein [Planctomycetes bacterium]|nr:tetratricopeptide repeat protein [Planctomycetota bacterium]
MFRTTLLAAQLLLSAGDPPTFTRDIAPIVFARCAACHHPGEAAPFALLSYGDLKKRAGQIVQVTQERFMPPWLPDSSATPFQDDRSLTSAEIEAFRLWSEAGCPEGDPAALPPAPVFASGWQLGEPDLVVTMPEAYTVPAEGRDIYRNFVIPQPSKEGRYVRALEFRPDNRRALHHAVLFVDGSRYARGEDQRDPEPGYPAMGLGVLRPPNGQFVSWTPGKRAQEYERGIAWRLEDELDIVLQLHLRPSGKPEPIQVSVGLYFSDTPPTKHPLAIRLWSREIDIPAGEKAYVVESAYTLPVDVSVYGIYPHAHYLGKDLRGWAVLPDGREQALIHIPAWDFNWQEEYFYRAPLALPAGTVVHMHYTFDNSAENPFNPSQPPKRVRHGYQSTDEMAELQLQVLTSEWERPILWHDFVQLSFKVDQDHVEQGLKELPGSVALHDEAFKYCLRRGDAVGALAHAQKIVELTSGAPDALTRVGQACVVGGEYEKAIDVLQQALKQKPGLGKAQFQLGRAFERSGRADEAQQLYLKVLERDPRNFLAHGAVGARLLAKGQRAEAAQHFEQALASNPEHLLSLWSLARIDLEEGRTARAKERCLSALEIAADEGGAHFVLGLIDEQAGRAQDARKRFELAVRFEPKEAEYRAALERAAARAAQR